LILKSAAETALLVADAVANNNSRYEKNAR